MTSGKKNSNLRGRREMGKIRDAKFPKKMRSS